MPSSRAGVVCSVISGLLFSALLYLCFALLCSASGPIASPCSVPRPTLLLYQQLTARLTLPPPAPPPSTPSDPPPPPPPPLGLDLRLRRSRHQAPLRYDRRGGDPARTGGDLPRDLPRCVLWRDEPGLRREGGRLDQGAEGGRARPAQAFHAGEADLWVVRVVDAVKERVPCSVRLVQTRDTSPTHPRCRTTKVQ